MFLYSHTLSSDYLIQVDAGMKKGICILDISLAALKRQAWQKRWHKNTSPHISVTLNSLFVVLVESGGGLSSHSLHSKPVL